MLFLAISIVWPDSSRSPAIFPSTLSTRIKGLLLGVALGLMILAARLGAFRKACCELHLKTRSPAGEYF